MTATTASGGTHKVFKRPKGKLRAHLFEYEGIDFIRDRNYVVVAPSRIAPSQPDYGHMPDGGTYRWLNVEAPIADLPDWLVAKLSRSDAETAIRAPDDLPDAPDEQITACYTAIEALPAAISGNGGDAATYRVAQECKRHGLSRGQALEMLVKVYNPRCKPPWLESALLHKLNSSYDSTDGPAFNCLRQEARAAVAGASMFAAATLRERAPRDLLERGDHAELAELLSYQITSKEAPAVYSDGSIYRYDETAHVFSPLDEHELSKKVQLFAGRAVATRTGEAKIKINSNDVTGTVRLTRDLLSRPDFFKDAKPGLAFRNGFVEVSGSGLQLLPHAPEHKARFAYSFDYAANTSQPEIWLGFLADVWRDDGDAKNKIALLQEFCGAMIFGLGTRFQQALLLVGDGSNGKGVTFKVIEALMPPGSACSVAPQEMANEYYRAKIMGKLVNMVAELPDRTIQDTTAFKAFIAGDLLTVRPIREAPYDGRPIAAHLYSCNILPGTTDTTPAFWRRWLILSYGRTYDASERIDNLAEEIIELERAEIVTWAAEGAARLLKERHYTVPSSSERAIDVWQGSANIVRSFIEENYDRVRADTPKKAWTLASSVFERFSMWCFNQHIDERLSASKFADRMRLIRLSKDHSEAGAVFPITAKLSAAAPVAYPTS